LKIASVRIENFRSFKDQTIPFNDYTCLVGPNGAGKSTVLTALNVFFRESNDLPTDLSQLNEEDFHCRITNNPVKITVTFTDLSDDAKKDFADYVRQDQLVVSAVAVFDENTRKAPIIQYGQRKAINEFASFFEASKSSTRVKELKKHYEIIQKQFPELESPGTKDSMIQALQNYESEHPDHCELIPSEDQFYGFTKGKNLLNRHIQWVYVPAVKDASSEQVEAKNSALGKLLSRTVRYQTDFDKSVKLLRANMQGQYQDLLDANQNTLNQISQSLQNRLSEWSHPNARLRLQWKQDPDKSVRVEEPWAHTLVKEGKFEGELTRFGHGLQRSYLLALLQELSNTDAENSPTLILACEEPELYQHPPQARHLASVLNKLRQVNSQVIVSTHQPVFISGEGFEDVRMVRKDDENLSSLINHTSFAQIAGAINQATEANHARPQGIQAKIHQSLQTALNEMFFTRRVILVEGFEDVAYLQAYFDLLDLSDNFRCLGCHIIPANGKSELLRPLAISKQMKIPTYLIFDSDATKKYRMEIKKKHENDNRALFKLIGACNTTPFPLQTVWGKGYTVWSSDIGTVVEDEIGKTHWGKYQNQANQLYGHIGHLKKNSLHIGASLAYAWEDNRRSKSLEKLCKKILEPDNYIPFN